MTYGYLQDPELRIRPDGSTEDWIARDLDVGLLLAKSGPKTDGDVDFRPFCTSSHQGSLSSCVGNATADAVEILTALREADLAVKESRAPRPVPQLSRMFVYSMARTLESQLDQDAGTHIRTAFEVLNRFGICEEKEWAHDPAKVYTSPSLLAQRAALGHTIHSYYRIKETGPDRVHRIVEALQSGYPVVFGTKIDSAFNKVADDSPIGIPTGPWIGGHAMIVVGYQDGLFWVKNSWGKGWGQNGFGRFTPEYLGWENTWDLWVPTLGWELGG